MEQKEYNRYVKRWKKYLEEEKIYCEERRKLVVRSDSGENVEREFEKLDKRFGRDFFGGRRFGPYTVIKDALDLLNPNFILPGFNVPFCDLSNTDKNIPSYFGKKLYSDLEEKEGIVIGYSYDAYDDYIIIETEDNKIVNVMVNSHYHIVE